MYGFERKFMPPMGSNVKLSIDALVTRCPTWCLETPWNQWFSADTRMPGIVGKVVSNTWTYHQNRFATFSLGWLESLSMFDSNFHFLWRDSLKQSANTAMAVEHLEMFFSVHLASQKQGMRTWDGRNWLNMFRRLRNVDWRRFLSMFRSNRISSGFKGDLCW